MRKLGNIAQAKVQALASNRVQGLGCITNGDNTLCGQMTSGMQTQGKYKTLARQGQPPQAGPKDLLKGVLELLLIQGLHVLGLLWRQTPDQGIVLGRFGVRQQCKGAGCGETLKGPALCRQATAYGRQHRLLVITAAQSLRALPI